MKGSLGCAKTVECTASLGARSPMLTLSSHATISSDMGQINSHLSSRENVSTGESHHLLRIKYQFSSFFFFRE